MLNAVQSAIAMGRKCGLMPVKITEFEVKGYRVHRGRLHFGKFGTFSFGYYVRPAIGSTR